MAASNENIAKTCENQKEKGVRLKENCKDSSPTNDKRSVDAALNGSSSENAKSIISQKSTPTQTHKSLHSTSSKASDGNHVSSEHRGKTDSKSSSETPAKEKKRHEGHGKRSTRVDGLELQKLCKSLEKEVRWKVYGHYSQGCPEF